MITAVTHINPERDALPFQSASHGHHALTVLDFILKDELLFPAVLGDGELELGLALLGLVLELRALGEHPVLVDGADEIAFPFGLTVLGLGLVLDILRDFDEIAAAFAEIGDEIELGFVLLFVGLGLRLGGIPAFDGIVDALDGEDAVYGIVLLAFFLVDGGGKEDFVVIHGVGHAAAEKVGHGDFHAEGVLFAVDDATGEDFAGYIGAAEQVFDEGEILFDDIDLRLRALARAVGGPRRRHRRRHRRGGRRLCRRAARAACGDYGADGRRAVGVEGIRVGDFQLAAGRDYVGGGAALHRKGNDHREHDGDDKEHSDDGDDRPAPVPDAVFAALCVCEDGLGGVDAEVAFDLLPDSAVGENFGLMLGEQLFHLFHTPSSDCSLFLSFLSASLFFHVTVPMGIPIISATSRRFMPAT